MIRRVAYLSMHTSPLLQPGAGYAGGMNVYVDELARAMAARGVDAVVFTRRTRPDTDAVVEVAPGYRVVHIDAGPAAEIPMSEMPRHVAEFAAGVLEWAYALGPFDVIHSHYWLSGWAGVIAKESLGIPLANSFHTLGRVKDLNRRADEAPTPAMRLLTEQEVIARSDCVIAATPYEFDDLLEHYGASPERLCVSPPGIDHEIFAPGDRTVARRAIGLRPEGRYLLWVGRIQPLKGLDVAVGAAAELMKDPDAGPHVELIAVGGPSGPDGPDELVRIRRQVGELGIGDRVHFVPPQPHHALADFYRSADVLLVPSRAESFGLVAAEAQACGLPVVAAAVGGLPYVVPDGEAGLLVPEPDPAALAGAARRVLSDAGLARRLSAGGVRHAQRFSWPATVDRLLELYQGIRGAAPAPSGTAVQVSSILLP